MTAASEPDADLDPTLQAAADLFATVEGGAVESYGEWGGMGDFYWAAGVHPGAVKLRCTVVRRGAVSGAPPSHRGGGGESGYGSTDTR